MTEGFFQFCPLAIAADPKEKLLEDEVHAFNALLDEEKFDREQQLMSPSTLHVTVVFWGTGGVVPGKIWPILVTIVWTIFVPESC